MTRVRQIAIVFCALSVSSITKADIITVDSESAFVSGTGGQAVIEDWSSYAQNTVLEDTDVNGITYSTTDSSELVVGSSRAGGWRLGYSDNGTSYRSFSSQLITFDFSSTVDAFGILLSQGNQSGGVREVGYSLWNIYLGGFDPIELRVDFGLDDFTGDGYFGFLSDELLSSVSIRRVYSTRNIVWNTKKISYRARASIPGPLPVPEPTTLALFGLGFAGIGVSRLSKR